MGLGVIRFKIWYDLWENRGRTMRVVAIIAIGVFAIGTVLGGKEFIQKDMNRTWLASAPATIGLDVKPAVDDKMIETMQNLQGLEQVEGWYRANIQWRRTSADPWQPAQLLAIDDYEEQSIRKIVKDSGDWPERKWLGAQRGYNLSGGDQAYLKIDNGKNEKEHQVRLNGVLYSAAQPPVGLIPEPAFYTTREHFKELTGEPNYNLIFATITNYNPADNLAAADRMQRELEKQDIEVSPALLVPGGFRERTNAPDHFIAQDVLNSVFLILTILAVATLILGLFLVYNTVNAVIAQQTNQIGIMKAVGATLGQILMVYFSMIFVYAFLALLIAAPLGALGAYGLRVFLISRFGMIPGPFEFSANAVLTQAAVALLSPLIASLLPILSGARITVREAVSTYGLNSASSLLERVLARLRFIPRLASLTVSNTFRNKRRVLLTQLSLMGAGAMFMMVLHIRATVVHTYSDVLFSIFEVNVMLDLKDPQRLKEIEAIALAHPGVTTVEVWSTGKATLRPLGQPEGNDDATANLRGLPLPTQTYRPQLRAGRWLQPDDDYAVVLNEELAKKVGLKVGDWITIDIPLKRESSWQVVGLIFEPLDLEAVSMPRPTLMRELRQMGQGKAIKVQTSSGNAQSEAAIVTDLRREYEARGYELQVSREDTSHRLTEERVNRLSILLYLLTGMAVMVAVVGAVALSGTLSINVLERTREIGVMRAIGASALVVAGQFIGEGLILGWLSWLLAWPLSIPASQAIIRVLSGLLRTNLVYQDSLTGAGYWFVIITVLAVIASWLPAQKAAQTSVRESLAYV